MNHYWRNYFFKTRKAIGRHNSWNVESLLARSGDAHVLPANRTVVETSNRVQLFVVLSAYFSALSRPYPLQFLHADPPQRERDSFRSRTFSLFLALIDSREPAFTRPPTARYCKLLTALLLGLLLTLSYPIISYTRHATPFHRLWHHKITT